MSDEIVLATEHEPEPSPSCDAFSGLYDNATSDGCVLHLAPAPEWIEPATFGFGLSLLMLAALVMGQLRKGA